MLVLSRHEGEEILIGPDIVVRVCEIMGKRVRIGVSAPFEVKIDRREVRERIEQAELGGES